MSVNNQVRYGRILRPHCGNVKFPFFADDNMRLDSFRTWRGHQDRDLRNLVENGFFYTRRRVKTIGHSSTDPPIYAGHSDHGDGQSDSSRISHEQGSGDTGDMATASVTEECEGKLTRCLDSPGVHIGDVLNSPAALSLLQNGYDKESVTRAVVDLCEQGHMDFKSKDLLELINSWEE